MSTITKQWLQQTIAEYEANRDELPFGLDTNSSIELEAFKLALASLEAEPVAYIIQDADARSRGEKGILRYFANISDEDINEYQITVTPLYTAPTAPVVPDDVMAAIQKVARIRLDLNDFDGDKRGILDCLSEAEEALIEVVNRRAAMLQGAEPVTTAYKLPANTPCKDAPEHIWLQTAGVWPENGEFSELTWCSDNQHPDDTLYVRADVVTGNSPVIPDGWVACSERMPENDDFVYIWPRPDFGVELHVAQYGKFDKRDAGWYAQVYEQNYGIEYYPVKVTHWMTLPAAPQQEAKNV